MRLIPSFLQRSEAERTGTMSVMEHLEELRRRIVIAFFAVLGGAVVGWFLYPYVLELPPGSVLSVPARQSRGAPTLRAAGS